MVRQNLVQLCKEFPNLKVHRDGKDVILSQEWKEDSPTFITIPTPMIDRLKILLPYHNFTGVDIVREIDALKIILAFEWK